MEKAGHRTLESHCLCDSMDTLPARPCAVLTKRGEMRRSKDPPSTSQLRDGELHRGTLAFLMLRL